MKKMTRILWRWLLQQETKNDPSVHQAAMKSVQIPALPLTCLGDLSLGLTFPCLSFLICKVGMLPLLIGFSQDSRN